MNIEQLKIHLLNRGKSRGKARNYRTCGGDINIPTPSSTIKDITKQYALTHFSNVTDMVLFPAAQPPA